jgi:hypothetical protein
LTYSFWAYEPMSINRRSRSAPIRLSVVCAVPLAVILLCGLGRSLEMRRIATLDCTLYGPLCCGDANHNGFNEILAVRNPGSESLVIFEHVGSNVYDHINTTTIVGYVEGYGDGDGDSLNEIIGTGIEDTTGTPCVCLLESPDRLSFPSRVVWQVPSEGRFHHPLFTDLDRDGRREMAFSFDPVIRLYETDGNDSYSLVSVLSGHGPFGDFCVDDFDHDGLTELMAGSEYDRVCVWEATGNDNEYVQTWVDSVDMDMNYNTCAPGDMDGDG